MRLLHTSDWHVGKKIRGHSRADEHRAVLAEIVVAAESESVDLVAVAGDLYETAAPNPESERIVTDALLRLAEVAPVVAVAGNHDNARRLSALEPLLRLGRITMVSDIRSPAAGGTLDLTTESGTPVRLAFLPFVSQRSIVRTAELMSNAAYENAQTYADRLQRVLEALCAGFDPDHVNLVIGHAFVHGGMSGGGERAAHIADEYGLSAVDFPPTASYVALGHLHRAQQMLGATAIHYCGSPLQLDFGEQDQAKQVNVVDVEPGLPAKVRPIRLTAGRRLRTLKGTVAELRLLAEPDPVADDETGSEEPAPDEPAPDEPAADQEPSAGLGDAWLRVIVTEPGRAGLADEVREALGPNVVDVRIEDRDRPTRTRRRTSEGRTPRQLFTDYLAERNVEDRRLEHRFVELYDEAGEPTGPGDGGDAGEAPGSSATDSSDPASSGDDEADVIPIGRAKGGAA